MKRNTLSLSGMLALVVSPFFVTTASAQTYCSSASVSSTYEAIYSVKVGSVTKTSGAAKYSDFTSTIVPLAKGATTTVSLTAGFPSGGSYAEKWGIYLDLNHDFDFLDPGELVYSGTSSGTTPLNGSLIVPSTALTGPTRMRVVMFYGGLTPGACGTSSYGEVEDYTADISNQVSATPTPTPAPAYCTSASTSSAFEYIAKVQLNEINNPSSGATYTDFTAKKANLVKGAVAPITLTAGFYGGTYSEKWAVYIDLNQDLDFTDPGELVFSGTSTGTTPLTGNITIPATTTSGSTRMRVAMQYGSTVPPPCGTIPYGEVEDYTVTIVAPPPPSPSPTPTATPTPVPSSYCAVTGPAYISTAINIVEFNPNFYWSSVSSQSPAYEDFTAKTIELPRGGSVTGYLASISSSPNPSARYFIWADLNKNMSFDDAGELIYQSPVVSGANLQIHPTVSLPLSAPLGTTRMRIRVVPTGVPDPGPCGQALDGQTEDYTLIVRETGGAPLVFQNTFGSAGIAAPKDYNLVPYGLESFQGKPYIFGQGNSPNLSARPVVQRFDAFGVADPTYVGSLPGSPASYPGACLLDASSWALSMAVQPDGKIITVSFAQLPADATQKYIVRRSNIDGTSDSSFGTSGKIELNAGTVDGAVIPWKQMKVVPLANGMLLLATTVRYSGVDYWAVKRLTSAGALDPTFGVQGTAMVSPASTAPGSDLVDLVLQPVGDTVYAVLAAQLQLNTTRYLSLVRFTAGGNGTPDQSFGSGNCAPTCFPYLVSYPDLDAAAATPFLIAAQPDGKLVVARRTYGGNLPNLPGIGVKVVRYLASGAQDMTFGDAGVKALDFGEQPPTDLLIQPGSSPKIILALGRPAFGGGALDGGLLVRLHENGNYDLGFNPTGGALVFLPVEFASIINLAADPSTKRIFVAGERYINSSTSFGGAVLSSYFYESPTP